MGKSKTVLSDAIITLAVREDGLALKQASKKNRDTESIELFSGKLVSNIIENWDDKAFVLEEVNKDGYQLAYASQRLRDDKVVVIAAVNNIGDSLEYASERLRDHKIIVLQSLKDTPFSLKYASERLRDDRDVAIASIQKNGSCICFLSERLRNDKSLALLAVGQNSVALKYISQKFTDDEDVVMAAVSNHEIALQYASDRLRSDIDFCIQCANVNINTIDFFCGEAAELFLKYNNNLSLIEGYHNLMIEINVKNSALLEKLANSTVVVNDQLFKRKLF